MLKFSNPRGFAQLRICAQIKFFVQMLCGLRKNTYLCGHETRNSKVVLGLSQIRNEIDMNNYVNMLLFLCVFAIVVFILVQIDNRREDRQQEAGVA